MAWPASSASGTCPAPLSISIATGRASPSSSDPYHRRDSTDRSGPHVAGEASDIAFVHQSEDRLVGLVFTKEILVASPSGTFSRA